MVFGLTERSRHALIESAVGWYHGDEPFWVNDFLSLIRGCAHLSTTLEFERVRRWLLRWRGRWWWRRLVVRAWNELELPIRSYTI